MLRAIGRLCTRYPRRVLAFWGVLLLLALPLAGRVGEVLTTDAGVAPGSEAQTVRRTLLHAFSGNRHQQLVIVADGDADTGGDAAQFSRLLRDVQALPAVESVVDHASENALPLPDLQGRAQGAALVTLAGRNRAEVERVAEEIRTLLPTYETDTLQLFLTGTIPVEREINEISARDSLRAELFGLPLSLLVLSVAFGAPIAACLPLLVAVLSITLSLAALFLLGQAFAFATFAQIVVTMLGLATGIDYALLMVNRFREELPRQGDAVSAAFVTTQTAGKAVAFSGLTVLVALGALLVPPLTFVQSMGVASLIVMFFSVLVSLTALPAALTLLGERVNSLRVSRLLPGSRSRPFWLARARAVTERPLLWTLVGVGTLLLLALPLFRMEVAFSGVRGLTENTETRQAQAVLENLGLDSLLRSYDVLIDFGERGFFHPSSVGAVARVSRAAAELSGVTLTLTPTTAGLPPLLLSGLYASQATAEASPLAGLVRTTVSRDGRFALLRVFSETDITPSAAARLERSLRRLTQDEGLTARVGGNPVAEREWAAVLYRSFPLAVGLVYLATFVLLGLAFRSLLIPLKSIVLNTLTVGAAFGVITAVFQLGWGAGLLGLPGGLGFVETSVPIFIFAIVFGLSMDYEVFLVARVVEHHEQGASDRDAVVAAVGATGGVITSAALIMGVVFFVFLFSHVVLIKTLALGLTVAVLLDATLVRLVLVPAVMMLAGRWNWWLPRRVAQLAKRVDLGHD